MVDRYARSSVSVASSSELDGPCRWRLWCCYWFQRGPAAPKRERPPRQRPLRSRRRPPPATGNRQRIGGAEAAKNKQPAVDPHCRAICPPKGSRAGLKSVGSDTMNNLLALWSEDFRKIYPSVRIEIEGKGSGTAPPALIQGTADFGPMSRDMNPDEIAQFTSAFGYPPAQLPVRRSTCWPSSSTRTIRWRA